MLIAFIGRASRTSGRRVSDRADPRVDQLSAEVAGASEGLFFGPPLAKMSEIKVESVRTEVELDAAVGVWRQANIARGAPHGPERTACIRAKLSASDALPFVALRPEIVGMALAEPGRFDGGAGELDPSLLHISMVFGPSRRTTHRSRPSPTPSCP
ncbi:MAG: GCN5-related N-acetyltransferase [Solirubrobacterales bacterium]|nr:GCN5-related N-acetyltransferase [Solirubrobacterales bacterium]